MSELAKAGESKRAILDYLKQNGPSEASAIAVVLGVTAMAVRQHLYALADDGLVSFAPAPKDGGRGRPAKLWQIESRANSYFADAHAELSVELIGNIREIFGARGLDKLIERRTQHQITAYRSALSGASTLRDKVKRLTKLRTDAGYLAEMQPDGEGFLLVENHCPVCRAAQACSGLCRQELEVFRAALGPEVTIERTDHILAGARRCAYQIHRRKS